MAGQCGYEARVPCALSKIIIIIPISLSKIFSLLVRLKGDREEYRINQMKLFRYTTSYSFIPSYRDRYKA